MKRPARIALTSVGVIVFLALLAVVTTVFIARSDWLREKLRTAIIEQAELATGGRVEIGNIGLQWTTLTANVDGLVIHGTEAPSQAPLLRVDHVAIGFRIISLFSRDVRLDKIDVLHPRVHIIVDGEGGTNLPRPKIPSKTRTADDILNVRVAHFSVSDGEALAESPGTPPHVVPWSGQGSNLAVKATYDRTRDRYAGDVSIAPVHLMVKGYGPLDVSVQGSAAMERNRVVVSRAKITTANSEINLSDVTIGSFADPVVLAFYDIKASSAEVIKALHLKVPVSGPLTATGKARYVSPHEFSMTGTYRGAGLSYGDVHNIRLTGNLAGTQKSLTLSSVRVNLLGGEAVGSVELKDYTHYDVRGTVNGLDARDVAALGTKRALPYDGVIAGTVEASGLIRDLSGSGPFDASARMTVSPATAGPPVHGEIFAHYDGTKLEMGHSWLELPSSRVDVTGTLGATLTVKLDTKNLNDLLPVLQGHTLPFTLRQGSATFTGTVTGALADPNIAGHLAISNAVYDGRLIDSAVGDVTASMNRATAANAVIVSSGITATGNGSIQLTDWATTDASVIAANVVTTNVDITHALDLAGYKDVQVTGTASVNARVSGTLGKPVGNADVSLIRGSIYQQPYDAITNRVQYVNADLQTVAGIFVSGPKRVTFDVSYPHAGKVFPEGTLQITASSNSMALNQIALVRERQPDIQGSAQFNGTGALRISRDAKNQIRVDLVNLSGDGSVTGIGLAGRDLGDAHFTARTQGNTVTANFDSNAAKATIKGEAKIELTGDDHTTGTITFSNVALNPLTALLVTPEQAKALSFDGAAEGQIDFNGPLFAPQQMSASATIRQFEVHPLAGSALAISIPAFSLHNTGPVKVSVEKSVIRVDAARFQAPETDLTLTGTADLTSSSPLDVRLQGTVNLAILRNFVPDMASSGIIAVNGTVRGPWSLPDLSGTASIKGGEFHYADFTNGLSNATGEIIFTGKRATIQSFNADTGGGKFTGSGWVTLGVGGAVGFQLTAVTKDVRLRYPQGVSSISDSNIQIVRNAQRSSISGTVIVRRLVINPQQDTSAMLADMSQSPRTPATGDTVFANMNLDVLIQTAPDVALQSSVAQSIQADANLRLRGTVSSPALLGRINVSQGEIIFFGNKYTISQGAISFSNPTRIDPILKVDLQTKARGVEVTMTVTGPPGNFNMTYRSDPPLELSEIVALLAYGATPNDLSLAARGNAPTQSFEQLGAQTLIGKTLADPISGRLQRFFGVSRLKIDPQLTGVTGNPGARVTVEQQVTPDILFTYITDVSNTSQQLIRVEWSFNRNWSAILVREENGYVGLDFAYKKRFK